MEPKINRTLNSLRAIAKAFPGKVAFSTSLGEEDQVLTWFIAKFDLPISIFTLDTGRLFNESYELIERTQKKYGVQIDVRFPEQIEVRSMINEHGINGFYNSIQARKACCSARKIRPLKLALQHYDAWITGLRNEQSNFRQALKYKEKDDFFEVTKFNPLHHWSLAEIQALIKKEGIPSNPLHSKGFVSIGCAPCTRAISHKEHPRDGRWWWENSKKECGLHTPEASNK